MKFIYQLFISLYPLIARIISTKNEKAKLWIDGRIGIFDKLKHAFAANTNKVIWMHCASLGEFEQGRPIIEEIKAQAPSVTILVTFFSPSGFEVCKNYELADWIFYLPIDSASNATKFYDIVNPSLVIFVKYEFWYYYLQQAKLRNIPLILASGIFRNNQPFFKRYGAFNRQMLSFFSWFFVQNETSVSLLKSIGIENNVTLSGDTRFDRVISIAEQFSPIYAIENFIGDHKQVIVAGSTWLEDDEILYHYTKTHPHVRFIIAPHDIQKARIDECLKLYPNAVTFSDFLTGNRLPLTDVPTIATNKRPADSGNRSTYNTLIIDNIGMLSKLYKYATICFVGGAFGDDGVHNVLEAAVYGKPVVFGPEYSKYQEAIHLIDAKSATSIENTLELEDIFNQLLQNTNLYSATCLNAKKYVYDHSGATKIIARYIYEKRLFTN